MTALDIQIAVAKLFNWRQNIIIPNVSWGIGLRHEADLVIANKVGFLKEIEIKISASDIKADTKKGPRFARGTDLFPEVKGYNFHMEGPIRQLYFAVPEKLAGNPNIPGAAGIIAVYERLDPNGKNRVSAKIIRYAKINKGAKPLSNAKMLHLLHLGCMRIWSLKEHLAKKASKV